jgi:hemoglobin-like flavoprotein
VVLNVSLLRKNFELVTKREPRLAGRFYEILFERYPQLRPMFGRNSAATQERMIARALADAIDRFEDVAWMSSTLALLGARHASYGVTEEMYAWLVESLIATFAEVAGPDWTPDLADAWAQALGAISSMMITGLRGQR